MMNVLFVSAEVDPFAKVGGLADVVGSLPAALRKQNVDARVLMPMYGTINRTRYNIQPLITFTMDRRVGRSEITLFHTVYDGVPIYFIQGWPYFGDETSVYTEWNWDMPRFIFFCQAVLAAADALCDEQGWFPDVFHVNDWHTGLVPFLIQDRRGDARWQKCVSVLGIHNMAYQGDHAGGWLWEFGVAGRQHPELEWRGLQDNMLAIALAYSEGITTVSPRYAVEIQYPYAGYGLDGLVRSRLSDLTGILNGIDTGIWNPETDPLLASRYNAANFRELRGDNKAALQADTFLPVRGDVPVIGWVSRLVWQKGIDLAVPALRRLLAGYDVQFVALGSGEPDYNRALESIGWDFGWKARVQIGYNAAVAQRIYAGSDMFIMPSHYEPCGIGQMIAMRYGSLPVVRETGGLADTVANYDGYNGESGTGFVFNWETDDALFQTLRWAVETYQYRRDAFERMQERAMQTDFGWHKSAEQYIDVYKRSLSKRG
jgi:starch synthase